MKKVGKIIIPGITILSGLFTIISGINGISTWFSDSSPIFKLYYNGKDIKSGDNRNVVICIDDTTNSNSMEDLFPVFKNSTTHSAKDFAMIYTFLLDSIDIEPKDDEFSLSYDGDKKYKLKYKENMVPAHFYVKEPIRKLKVMGEKAQLKMEVYATYEGVPDPYNYNANAQFFYVNSTGRNYKEWKDTCLQLIANQADLPQMDILYASNKYNKEYEFNRFIRKKRIYPSLREIAESGNVQIFGVAPSKRRDSIKQHNNKKNDQEYRIKEIKIVDEIHFKDSIGIHSYAIKKNKDGVDSLSMVVMNGYDKDTTVILEVQSQNITTKEIETDNNKIPLTHGKNVVSLPIRNHNIYIGCTFNPQEYNGDNNIDNDIVLKITVVLLILLGLLLCYLGVRILIRWGKNKNPM